IFIGVSPSGLLDSAENQIAPGSHASSTSSGDRLSQNGNASLNSNGSSTSTTNGLGSLSGSGSHGMSGFGRQTTPRGGGGAAAAASLDGRLSSSGNGQPVLQDVRITPDLVNN